MERSLDEFQKEQADILSVDITNNPYLPSAIRISENKSLNTTKKNVIGAINEIFSMIGDLSEAPNTTDPTITPSTGGGSVSSVNGILPDLNGNVKINQVNSAFRDGNNNRIDTTYATKDQFEEIMNSVAQNSDDIATCVKTINGVMPSASGNVTISTVALASKAMVAARDENNNNIVATYATKEDVKIQLASIVARLTALEKIVNGGA